MKPIYMIAFGLLFSHALSLQAQSKKEIKNAGIVLSSEYKTEDGERTLFKTEAYDTLGNCIEEKSYTKQGDVESWKTYTFNADGKKTEESIINPVNGNPSYTEKFYYEDGEVSKKEEYTKGKLKKQILYEYLDGFVIKKTVLDGKGKTISIRDYEYTKS